jgi:hypothetical protein
MISSYLNQYTSYRVDKRKQTKMMRIEQQGAFNADERCTRDECRICVTSRVFDGVILVAASMCDSDMRRISTHRLSSNFRLELSMPVELVRQHLCVEQRAKNGTIDHHQRGTRNRVNLN